MREKEEKPDPLATWQPRTTIGKKVKAGEITAIGDLLDAGTPILEPEIVDTLLPSLETDLLLIGQSKGKFGGGQRRVFRQTQKKTQEGNKPSFAALAVVGNKNGFVGVGYGKSRETVPAREKAVRAAKLNVMRIRRGSGSWQSRSRQPHSIPFAVVGKCGSIRLKFMPAPKGTGLVAGSEIQKILRLAGIQDVWSELQGKSKSRVNVIYACVDALQKLVTTKTQPHHKDLLGIVEGDIHG